ncbi:YfhH family protein [Pullulanibacillus sp. KACC 23026]|uniref:YfhH family protein n=1 Tax=Pullulanibacillus sp. KACC 23026 TaxID=3028315 RepID=UPI0023AFACDC|nr:YfhH family protein [Pullulanibacillus sp. KACC 23026]WEG12276.1 YfhH family protein [Pullulanibacillus sp. KACC 23026]
MNRRYSDMTEFELREEIKVLREKVQQALSMGNTSEMAVYERKSTMAHAYLLDPNDFKQGETYYIKGDEEGAPLTIEYLDGVFAWGTRGSANEPVGFPISLLEKREA